MHFFMALAMAQFRFTFLYRGRAGIPVLNSTSHMCPGLSINYLYPHFQLLVCMLFGDWRSYFTRRGHRTIVHYLALPRTTIYYMRQHILHTTHVTSLIHNQNSPASYQSNRAKLRTKSNTF